MKLTQLSQALNGVYSAVPRCGSDSSLCITGCELSSKTLFYTFKVDEDDDFEPDLSLCTVSPSCYPHQ